LGEQYKATEKSRKKLDMGDLRMYTLTKIGTQHGDWRTGGTDEKRLRKAGYYF
jgi:hypothetical protein